MDKKHPSYSYQQWDVDKLVWLCHYDRFDGKDDGVAVKDPNINFLLSFSSRGMAGDL